MEYLSWLTVTEIGIKSVIDWIDNILNILKIRIMFVSVVESCLYTAPRYRGTGGDTARPTVEGSLFGMVQNRSGLFEFHAEIPCRVRFLTSL